jgi:hypothetical protein
MKTIILLTLIITTTSARAETTFFNNARGYIEYYILRPLGQDEYSRKLRRMAQEQIELFEKFTEIEVQINLKRISIEKKAELILELLPLATKMERSFLGEIAFSRKQIAYELNLRLLFDDDKAFYTSQKTLLQYVNNEKYSFNLANFYGLRFKAAEQLCRLVETDNFSEVPFRFLL